MKHISEEDLILIHYGEAVAPEHLQTCAECAGALDGLRRTLQLFDELPVPEPRVDLEGAVWAAIEPQVKPRRFAWRWILAPAFGLALALLVAFLTVRPARQQTAFSEGARRRMLSISLADHLDRSQMLLTELENAPEEEVEPLRLRAQDLLDEGRLMRQWIPVGEPGATVAVMDEVERVLVETANTGGRPEEIRALREQIGEDSLVFKVKIVEANLRTGERKS
jgi:hypothetical protein